MGLDMYLYQRGAEQGKELVYWRKANAVHRFHVCGLVVSSSCHRAPDVSNKPHGTFL